MLGLLVLALVLSCAWCPTLVLDLLGMLAFESAALGFAFSAHSWLRWGRAGLEVLGVLGFDRRRTNPVALCSCGIAVAAVLVSSVRSPSAGSSAGYAGSALRPISVGDMHTRGLGAKLRPRVLVLGLGTRLAGSCSSRGALGSLVP
jgi:hypothetical protein